MTKLIGVLLTVIALIFGTIVGYNIVSAVVPQYMTLWIISVVFTWVGIFLTNIKG